MIAHCLVCQAAGGFSVITVFVVVSMYSVHHKALCVLLNSLVKAICYFVDQQEQSECFCPADRVTMLKEGWFLHANNFSAFAQCDMNSGRH